MTADPDDSRGTPSPAVIEAHAHGAAHAYIAGRDVHVTTHAAPTPAMAALHTLPRDVVSFSGRDADLSRLLRLADRDGRVSVCVVDGMPGVGKTALVTRAAHLLADRYPDGQMFVRLHAYTPGQSPVDPAEVLASLLVASGLAPQEVPSTLDGRALKWRDRLAGKRVMLVLDDALAEEQVEPLLPGTPGSLVLITSRNRLVAFEGADALELRPLTQDRAVRLFTELARLSPAGDDARLVGELTEQCGHLPLAIALLAGRLHRSGAHVAEFAAAFQQAQDRLNELATSRKAVAAAFEMSYRGLPATRRRFFRRLGLHPGTEMSVHATAALGGIPPTQARCDLEALFEDHLIDQPAPGRYRFHDLVRAYARNLAKQDPPQDREGATERLLDYYQHAAQTADRLLGDTPRTRPAAPGRSLSLPALDTPEQALAWMLTERNGVLACIRYASKTARHTRVVRLTAAISAFLRRRGSRDTVIALHQSAIAAANRAGDQLGKADALWELGRVRYLGGDFTVAAELEQRALRTYVELGDRLGQADALRDLGRVRAVTSDFSAAAGLEEQALRLYRDLDDRLGEANALWELGRVRYLTGEYAMAGALEEQALDLYRDLGDRLGEANALRDLGRLRADADDLASAAELEQRALGVYRDLGNLHGEANALRDLAHVRHLTGDHPAADELLRRSTALFRRLGDGQGEASVLNATGALRADTVAAEDALAVYREALQVARRVGSPLDQAHALRGAALCHTRSGSDQAALADLREAVSIYRRIGAPEAAPAAEHLVRLRYP